MRSKLLILLALLPVGVLGVAENALADNNATGSVGAVQVGSTSASPSAGVDSTAATASVSAPMSTGGGDNNASNSVGAVQVGGGNTSTSSTGTAQASQLSSSPSVAAGSGGNSATVNGPVSTGTGGGNNATGSTGAVQLGGDNSASASTGSVQVGNVNAAPAAGAAAAGAAAAGGPTAGAQSVPATAGPAGAQGTPGRSTIGQLNPTPSARRSLGTPNSRPAGMATLRQLPFTGLMLGLAALLGALLTTAGLGLRSYARS
jgi:hypothetical protein